MVFWRADEDVGVGARVLAVAHGGRRVAVEILASDGDAGDETVELVAVLVDGLLESGNLVVESLVTGRSPETEEQGGLGADGGGDGGDGVVVGVALDHGEETSAVEGAVGAVEAGSSCELGLEVGLLLEGAIAEGGAVVEALESGTGRGGRRSEGQEAASRHCV